MEESNKTLALLLVAAIVVSLGGTIVSLNKLGQFEISSATGRATVSQGTANINITENKVVNVSDITIDFGTGNLNAGQTYCTMDSNDTAGLPNEAGCGTWNWSTNAPDYFVIDNIGSATTDITIASTSDSATFIAGTSSKYGYACVDTGQGSGTVSPVSGFTQFDTNPQPCVTALLPGAGSDQLKVYVQVGVGENSNTGQLNDIITFAVA